MFKLITGVLQDFFREIIKNEIEYYHLSFFLCIFVEKGSAWSDYLNYS